MLPTYGLPVLPGSWCASHTVLMARQFLSVPGGVLFSKPTFDEIVPQLIANDEITKEDYICIWGMVASWDKIDLKMILSL